MWKLIFIVGVYVLNFIYLELRNIVDFRLQIIKRFQKEMVFEILFDMIMIF